MRLLVHGASLDPADLRLRLAAAALALRGHAVLWSAGGTGSQPGTLPASVERVARGMGLSRLNAEVVLGGGARPHRAAFAAWRSRAHCMVLGLDRARVAGWNLFERWAWGSLYSAGLIEESEAETMRRHPLGLEPERIGLWSGEPPDATPDPCHPDVEILERACERALARQRARGARPAVFLDRDGTLVVERGYLSDPDDLELLPGVPAALRNLKAAGYALIVVSNQSGVGRGLFPRSRVYQAMARLRVALRAHGVEIDAIYFCPHRPEEGCACRKPGVALLERAAEDLQLSLAQSVMIGDKLLDAETGRNAGARGVLVRTGYGRDEEARLGGVEPGRRPDRVCDDLAAAAKGLLSDLEGGGEG